MTSPSFGAETLTKLRGYFTSDRRRGVDVQWLVDLRQLVVDALVQEVIDIDTRSYGAIQILEMRDAGLRTHNRVMA